ncbi:recombinase family protein [Rhodobacterales bacterium HKCCE2091]|nr:recombinase family protein [Rhodobacterales bacterium HKCCE2091]
MKSIGYARVSTSGQTLVAQLEQLSAARCEPVYQETISGVRSDRPELKKALAELSKGDVLIVTRLDRLARSTFDLLEIVRQVEGKGAKLRSLAEAWADTTTPAGRLILTVLGGLAEFERSLIAERTGEGRDRARREGRRLGRPPKLSAHQRDLVAQWRAEGQDNAQIARALGVSRSTVSRIKA